MTPPDRPVSVPTLFERRMFDVVSAINFWQQIGSRFREGTMADELLERKGYSECRAEALLERAAKHGFIDYGVSSRTGWLTDKGRRLLHDPRFSDRLNTEDGAGR